ncbi:sulfotransferase family 2 domain-containing protein [Synechococcus sp. A15-44]|uniref:sulfotransferase family 2 domain-containing protein n=1 Tax=Synechococcus sp. A15-44 TaxID=1050646 RepID=UPI001644A43E|nr:sulfotransferase family 2 domain-containing protein [Synechococcus sp. A15-44]
MAIVNSELGIVFLCTAKVASTSLEKALENLSGSERIPGGKHMGLRNFTKKSLPMLEHKYPHAKFTSFCIVREPLERLNSWWRYRARLHAEHKNSTAGMPFIEFVESHLEYLNGNKTSAKSNVQFSPQTKWVLDSRNKYVTDKVFAVEKFEEVEEFLQSRTSEVVRIRRRNVSPMQDNSDISSIQGKLLEDLKRSLDLDYKIHELALRSPDSVKQFLDNFPNEVENSTQKFF